MRSPESEQRRARRIPLITILLRDKRAIAVRAAAAYLFAFAFAFAACSLAPAAPSAAAPAPVLVPHPFAPASIWNRLSPAMAASAAAQGAIFGDPLSAPARAGPDLVTICATDATAPLVNIEQNQAWGLPGRAQSNGQVQYQRHLAPDACTGVTWNPIGNAFFVLIDPATGLADLGVGAWRTPGGPLLNHPSDGPTAHGLDTVNGDGIRGYGRASSLPALGGAIRPGEMNGGIEHALAVSMIASRFSSARHFVWPAQTADAFAGIAYQGPDPNYTLGSLLAIPPSLDLASLTWRTPQGLNLARAAQRYGWYIVDTSEAQGNLMNFGMDNDAALQDLGLTIDPVTGQQSVDPEKIDVAGFTADAMQILGQVSAVISNAPAAAPTVGGSAEAPPGLAVAPAQRPAQPSVSVAAFAVALGAIALLLAASGIAWRRRRHG